MDTVRLHQYGIPYAVATLGTATTPEHLKRVFRLVSEVVFAFDGDRAGRAAAWRALQQALPEAREGREMRFLFLPDGHDPDTLVGEEGREAFEERLASAIPLSEYLVRELTEQTDLSHADGRARFAAAARPLLAKVAPGVYRELLLGRIADVIGLAPQRLDELWNAGAKPAPEPEPEIRRARVAVSAGRGSLVRQAITRLLWYPAIASQVEAPEREALDRLHEPGVELLRDLIDNLRAYPAQLPAQVIERWADRPEGESLRKLLQKEEVITDPAAASGELRAALAKLARLADTQRLEQLQEKSRAGPLDAAEKLEFQRLMQRPRDGAASH